MKRIVVVGASLAGLATARALRAEGFAGELVMVGDEPHRPYDRPPLSKEFLAARDGPAQLSLAAEGEDLGLRWRLGTRAVGLAGHTVLLDVGAALAFDGLVVATGARARDDLPGARLPGVHLLRTLDDAVALREDLRRGGRVAVVGAGFIGSEVASTARALGCDVTLVVASDAPLRAALGRFAGAVADLHDRHHVEVLTGGRATEVRRDGPRPAVHLADGRRVPADTVVLGLGAVPAVSWLRGSGVRIGDGVLCDAAGATSRPGVVAVGDCSAWFDPALGRHHRVEHWTSARERGAVAARTLLSGGRAEPRPQRPPYLWSDIHGRRIQLAGHARLADGVTVEAGSVAEGSFVAVYRRGGEPVAVLGIDQPKQFMSVRRRLVVQGVPA
ncbi:FAD-dependent oxidoreductase [Dactylosporangium sp. NPDC005572]|uniref:NAD(P)/FAD-dependent oxidoreductase n=1 Tax=Dactylosporangium sp. NPDC005572 TaxID=3156889 RepID=UPI0033BF8167